MKLLTPMTMTILLVAVGLLEIISLGKCETPITEDDTKTVSAPTTVLDGSEDSTRSIGVSNVPFNLLGPIVQKIFYLALTSDTIRGLITSVAFPFFHSLLTNVG